MPQPSRAFHAIGLLACLFVFGIASALEAKDADPAVKKTFEKLMGAVQANDRDAFVANATDTVKEGTTEKVMDFLHKHLGTRLKGGYESTYLCELKQRGVQVYLWKLTFKDKEDDMVIRIGLREGKVDGFFLQ